MSMVLDIPVGSIGTTTILVGEEHTAPRIGTQTCVDEIDFDIDIDAQAEEMQPAEVPQ